MTKRLTQDLIEVYKARNSKLSYEPTTLSTKRAITNPSIPKHNGGADNENYDLILRVNDVIGSSVADDKEKWNCLQHESRYRIARMLGQGTFGQVVKCWDEKNHRVVAVKVLKNKLSYFRQGLLEIGILTAINTNCDRDKKKHCLRIFDHFIYKNHLCIVNELLGVNLYERMRGGGFQTFTISTIRNYLRQILEALEALETNGVVHCDLKPENVMVDGPRGENATLIDFGSACFKGNAVFTYIQSRHYRAPEVILEYPYSCPIDMWSLGCVAAEFFIGQPLFPGSSEYNQLYKITQLIGDVPAFIVENSRKRDKFYKKVEGGYVLKVSKEFTDSNMRNSDPDESGADDKRYLHWGSLMELVKEAAIRIDPNDPYEKNPGEIRELLFDFLNKTLTIDPQKRLKASEALRHPFITGKRQEVPTQEYMPPGAMLLNRPHPGPDLPMKTRFEGSFTEIYATFCRCMYEEEIVVDSSSGISLVRLEGPINPRRDPTQEEERMASGIRKSGDKGSGEKDPKKMDPLKVIKEAHESNQLEYAWRQSQGVSNIKSERDSLLFAKDGVKTISYSSLPKVTQRKKCDVGSLLGDFK